MPFLAERFVRLPLISKNLASRVPNGVEHELKRFYYDTVSRNVLALKLALEMFGVDRILFGTDYPFREDVMPQMQDIEDLKLSPAEVDAVLWRNAARVLKLGP